MTRYVIWLEVATVFLASTAVLAANHAPDSGKCGTVPMVKGKVFRYGDSLSVPERKWTVATEKLDDIDLDGKSTAVFRVPLVERLGPLKKVENLSWRLYLMRGGCAIDLGTYDGHAKPHVAKTSTNGMHDFSVIRPDPHPDETCKRHGNGCLLLTEYRFDGTRYVGSMPERR